MIFLNYQQLKYYTSCDCFYKYKSKTLFSIPTCTKIVIATGLAKKFYTLPTFLFFFIFFYLVFFQKPKVHYKDKTKRIRIKKRRILKLRWRLFFSCILTKNKILSFLHFLTLFDWNTISKYFLSLKKNINFFLSNVQVFLTIPIKSFFFDLKIQNLSFFKHFFFLKFIFDSSKLNKLMLNSYFLIQNSFLFYNLPIK